MTSLKRELGLAAVVAVVMGDMLGSGIFFTPGELARVATAPWQVYFIWALCGAIVLCGALTLGELATLFPRAGSTYHVMTEAYGPLTGFVKVWMEAWVSAPGSIAGVAIVFGEFVVQFTGGRGGSAPSWGLVAIAVFAAINLAGVRWGGRAQVVLTSVKIGGILALVLGSFFLADAVAPTPPETTPEAAGFMALLRFVGLGVAAVFFTYDGWTDVSHVAGEVSAPERNLPLGLATGVGSITVLYLIVNHAFLRVMPLERMREEGATVATALAAATFGSGASTIVSALIMISIAGALGGLVMTAPRIVFAAAEKYRAGNPLIEKMAFVSPRTGAPAGAILFSAALAAIAIIFFQTFDRLVAFILVPLQLMNVLTVAAIFRLRSRAAADPNAYSTPGYPFVPLVFVIVMSLLMLNAFVYNPVDTLYGLLLTAVGIPVYRILAKNETRLRS